jgi:hypothetical protein
MNNTMNLIQYAQDAEIPHCFYMIFSNVYYVRIQVRDDEHGGIDYSLESNFTKKPLHFDGDVQMSRAEFLIALNKVAPIMLALMEATFLSSDPALFIAQRVLLPSKRKDFLDSVGVVAQRC